MKRIEIYIDNNNSLTIDVYKSIEVEYPYLKLKGKEVYDFIKKISTSKIVDIYENENLDFVTLEYKNYIVNLNEYETLLQRRGMGPINLNLKSYYEKKEVKRLVNRKVKRKNKYSKRRIIAAGFALITIGSCSVKALELFDKEANKEKNSTSTISIDDGHQIEESLNEITIKLSEGNNQKMNLNLEETPEETAVNVEENVKTVSINYEDRTSSTKAITTKAYYENIINKYAEMYGLDSKLVLAIATQERGIHSGAKDEGGATGLMQIQNSVWVGKSIKAYNFNTNSWETVNIGSNDLSDLSFNIKMGCMVLQNNLRDMDYNPLAAIQCYNMGCGSMGIILNSYASDVNKTKEEILSNVSDTGWLNYRDIIVNGEKIAGDPVYIENVLSYYGDVCDLEFSKPDGTKIEITINNNEIKKVY